MIDIGMCISIRKQTWLLGISKSSVYYAREYTDEEVNIMDQIDEIYTEHPYYGSRRVCAELKRK
jgi:putative transposase